MTQRFESNEKPYPQLFTQRLLFCLFLLPIIVLGISNREDEKRDAALQNYPLLPEQELQQVAPYLATLVDLLFKNHQYSSYGAQFGLTPVIYSNEIDSIDLLDRVVGDRNVYLPLFSKEDKKTLLERLKKVRTEAAEYIQKSVREYIKQRYNAEAEVISIQVNGSSLYGWSKEKAPDDIDNVAIIRLAGDNILIRDHLYEMPKHLKFPGLETVNEFIFSLLDISGTAIQSVNGFNQKHPHTQTALISSYVCGIPIFQKERVIGTVDRKNLLFHAFSLLESGRKQFLSKNCKAYLKWINRLLDVKAILYKLGSLDWFDHHADWERFDEMTRKIAACDERFVEKFVDESLIEYVKYRAIIEKALREEKTKTIADLLAAIIAKDPKQREDFLFQETALLEKANGFEIRFPMEEPVCKGWAERRRLAMDRGAIEQEHLALLDLNDLAICLSLAHNSPFASVRKHLMEKGIAVVDQPPEAQSAVDEAALPHLLKLLESGDKKQQYLSLNALMDIGSPRAVPFIMNFASKLENFCDPSLMDCAIQALGRIESDKAISFLMNIIENDEVHKARAIQALLNLSKNPGAKFLISWELTQYE